MWTWPIIRHIRYYYYVRQVNLHYDMWRSMGYLPVNAQHDYEWLMDIWRGRR